MNKTPFQPKPKPKATFKTWWLGKGADLAGGAIIVLFALIASVALSLAAVFLWRSGNPGYQAFALLIVVILVAGGVLVVKD